MRGKVTPLRAGLAAVLTAASGLAVALGASPAAAAPLASTPVITNNLQGGNANKWTNSVRPFIAAAQVVALQEAGAEPPASSVHVRDHVLASMPAGPGQRGIVRQHRWQTSVGLSEIYFLQTDANGGRWTGGRVNTAIVIREEADEVAVVPNRNPDHRPALGVRLGDDWYFSFHAQSRGGALNDAPDMVQAIADFVGRTPGRHWTVSGDFNMRPNSFAIPANSQVYATGRPTHVNGAELDFAISSRRLNNHLVTRLNGASPDHFAVAIGGLQGGAEPTDPNAPDWWGDAVRACQSWWQLGWPIRGNDNVDVVMAHGDGQNDDESWVGGERRGGDNVGYAARPLRPTLALFKQNRHVHVDNGLRIEATDGDRRTFQRLLDDPAPGQDVGGLLRGEQRVNVENGQIALFGDFHNVDDALRNLDLTFAVHNARVSVWRDGRHLGKLTGGCHRP